MVRVQVLNEVSQTQSNDWKLCFQRARYVFDDGNIQEGFRFIWRWPEGQLQAARGQARIPSLSVARWLMAEAERQGWGHYDANNDDLVFRSVVTSGVAAN